MNEWARTIETAQANNLAQEYALMIERSRKAMDQRVLTLLLPVSALGLDGDTDVEIFVEYVQDRNDPVNPNKFVINVWVMETGIDLKMGVTTLFTPTVENEGPIEQAARILSVVSKSGIMRENLAKVIKNLRKSNHDYLLWLAEMEGNGPTIS